MKLERIVEQVMTSAVAPIVIPHGLFGHIIRRVMPSNGFINFSKPIKKKKKMKKPKELVYFMNWGKQNETK